MPGGAMFKLKLTERERDLIRLWIQTMREDAGHWGDGEVEFPEERRMADKLNSPEPVFTRIQLELILDWATNAAVGPDEHLLIRRLQEALAKE